MEQYIVSARKYRPDTFKSVVGQDTLVTTLKNAIQTQRLAHAYLFCGPRGVGKTTCARIFAKTINCSNLKPDGEACNECDSCRSFNDQRSLNIFELDAASNNGVDDIRDLIEQVMVPPQIGKYRVYIIDEVHMLTPAAFNAFLKTLEEPPSYAIFILATTEKHKILPTIISRCQVYDFNRIQIADTVEYLKYVAANEIITVEDEALAVIAQKADGAMRDALSIFDQIVSFCGKDITYKTVIENLNVLDYEYYFRLIDIFLREDVTNALLILNEIINKGFDIHSFVLGLSSHFRDLLVSRDEQTLKLLQVSELVVRQYAEQAAKCEPQFIYKALEITNQCELNYRISKNKRLLVELMLIKLCQIASGEENNNSNTPLKKIVISDNKPDVPEKNATVQQSENKSVVQTADTETKQSSAVQPLQQPAIPLAKNPNIINLAGLTATANAVETENRLQAATPAVSTQNEPISENQPFTQEQLNEAWQNYALSIENDTFFANTIKGITPIKEEHSCSILVLNGHQLKEITDKKPYIEKFISQKLHNTLFELKISKDTTIQAVKTLSPTDKLSAMLQKNPNLQEFVAELELEISY
ncbi:MAG: DNA polymerase III subunit gamma/tau [Prevotellaceae bacterium]|jgi:DNA polymerase-3 subunit gamma/tau|nr:DNA polymerase III subunit gamma/tau [Prevotellaceae bacterium]